MLPLDRRLPIGEAMQRLTLDDLWQSYLEPSCYGRCGQTFLLRLSSSKLVRSACACYNQSFRIGIIEIYEVCMC